MKKTIKSEVGVALITFAIIIFLILAVAFATIYFIFFNDKDVELDEAKYNNEQSVTAQTAEIEELGMDTRIVSTLTSEQVPIPDGYTYVSGDKNTGIIIKSNEYEVKYLFIPYNDNNTELSSEYYKKVSYIPMDLMTLNAIKKYKGFFVELNSNFKMEDLKTINNENYEFQYEQLKYALEDNTSINPHILYKEEIMLINTYLNNNKINLGENTIGIQALTIEPFSEINDQELVFAQDDNSNNTQNLGKIDSKDAQIVKTSNLKLSKVANTNKTNKKYVYKYETKSKLYGGSNKKKVNIPIPERI